MAIQCDEYGEPLSNTVLAKIPKSLTDPGCRARYIPGAIHKYRAYLERHPEDGGAWEGLAYLHLRLSGEEGDPEGLGAEGLVSSEWSSDGDLRAGHAQLAFEAERRAHELRPTSIPLRSSLLTTLSLAMSDALHGWSGGHYAGVIQSLRGLEPAQRFNLELIEDTLERFAERAHDQGGWICGDLPERRAQLLQEMRRFPEALTAWQAIAAEFHHERNTRRRERFSEPHLHLHMYQCALALGQLDLAERELDAAEAGWSAEELQAAAEADRPAPPRYSPHRLDLLEAQGRHAEAVEMAVREAAVQRGFFETEPDNAYLFRCADLLEYAGDLDGAIELLENIVQGDGHNRDKAQADLTRLQAKAQDRRGEGA